MVSAVRVTSSSLRGVVREGDIRALESWRYLFSASRTVAPGPLPATCAAAPEASVDFRQEESAAAHGHSKDARGGGARAAVVPAEGDAAGGRGGDAAGGGAGVRGRAEEAAEEEEEENAGPELYAPFPPMLSPVFSFEAAFEELRLEVAGDEGADADDVGGVAERGGLGGAGGVDQEGRSRRPEAAEEGFHRKADGLGAAVGGGGWGLSRSAESAEPPRSAVGGFQRRRRWWRSQVRRRSGAPSAVAEVKGIHAAVKSIDADSTKVRLLLLLLLSVSGLQIHSWHTEMQRTSTISLDSLFTWVKP